MASRMLVWALSVTRYDSFQALVSALRVGLGATLLPVLVITCPTSLELPAGEAIRGLEEVRGSPENGAPSGEALCRALISFIGHNTTPESRLHLLWQVPALRRCVPLSDLRRAA